MKLLRIVAIVAGVATAAVVGVGFLLPSDYGAERSIVVAAPPEVVFDQVNDLRKNEAWSPWKAKDDTMAITYSDEPVGEGAWYSWTSKNSGSGKLVITRSVRGEALETSLDFAEQGKAQGYWKFEAVDGGTKVTWGLRGNSGMNVAGRYMGLMMDRFVGPDFEDGLARLKRECEAN